jgi:hypothetical protein
MDPATKLRRIVADAKGDDLERAERAFVGASPALLDRQYGESGKTRREILAEYRREREEWAAAHALLESMLEESQ